MTHAFIVQCPSCEAGYLLPRRLVGSLGARVTCPVCALEFDVDPEGAAAGPPPHEPVRVFGPGSDSSADERAIAGEVLDELAARAGGTLEAAAREGRLFRDHGPALLEAFDAYRARAGEAAGAQAFREELMRRWHVDLFPLAEARG